MLSLLLLLFVLLSVLDSSLPKKCLNLIDYESLSAIISFFIISRGLELSGVFIRIAQKIVNASSSEFKLFFMLIVITSLSSAVIMNDTAMFIFVPLVLSISKITKIDLPKAVTVVAIAANLGSAVSPIGNPQNIIIWRSYKIPIFEFVFSMLPYVLLWIVLAIVLTWIGSKNEELETIAMPAVKVKKSLMLLSLILLTTTVALVENGHSPVGLFLTILIFLFADRDVLSLDIALIAIFALIFIDFKELSFLISNIVSFNVSKLEMVLLAATLSQIISNVPATVLLCQHLPWFPLAIGVNIGGVGMMIGSLANFIAIRISGIKLKDFHKNSLPYFLIAITLTILVLN